MLARSNGIATLVLLAIFGFAWRAALGPQAGIVAPALLALGSWLALWFVLALLSFAIAWRSRSPRPPGSRLGPLSKAWLLLKETLAMLCVYGVLIPLERLGRPALPDPNGTGDTAVLLLHGFLCNGGVWLPLRRALRKRGVGHVYTLNTEPPFGSISGFARQAAAGIDAIRAATGCRRVIVVAHSMGGLVARRMLDLGLGGDAVAGLITIGTPHHGTVHAELVRGAGTVQMRHAVPGGALPANTWLDRLNAHENEPLPFPVVAIYSHHDNFVSPQDSARLGCAETVELSGVGHLEMLFSRRVTEPVCRYIERWRAAGNRR